MTSVSSGDRNCAVQIDKTLFDHADVLELEVPSSCGRMGTCHECVVEIREGAAALSTATEAEAFLRDGYRLACQACVCRDGQDVEFALLRRAAQVLSSKTELPVPLDPCVRRVGDHVVNGTAEVDRYRGRILGIGLDVGTSTAVAELVDLESGVSLYQAHFENPQRFGGSDVISRIHYDSQIGPGELHRAMINTLNLEIRRMCAELDVSRHQIYDLVVVGNSTMRELFFGQDVEAIGQRPYKSDIELEQLAGERSSNVRECSARQLGISMNRNASVYGAPLVASHLGGDVAADLLALDVANQRGSFMLVDIGTNTEVIIGHGGRLLAASCPAGPAFEGGLVRFGMPACEGAIESIRRDAEGFHYSTIGGVAPQGFCGSGLIDLLAELRRSKWMTEKGVFPDKQRELTIVADPPLTLSREDASQLAQAKAANYCGQVILLQHLGIRPEEIDCLYLAGGFANYINVAAAAEIGFLAPVPQDRIVRLGNAALEGARQLLISVPKRQELLDLLKRVEHVELETTPQFFEMFVDGCQFKPMVYESAGGPTDKV